jgi:hypothetical protein
MAFQTLDVFCIMFVNHHKRHFFFPLKHFLPLGGKIFKFTFMFYLNLPDSLSLCKVLKRLFNVLNFRLIKFSCSYYCLNKLLVIFRLERFNYFEKVHSFIIFP